LPWWVGWVSPGITLCLGLAMLVFGSELWWRGAVRSLAPLSAQHWSERARIWFAWRGVISGWHVSVVTGTCLIGSVLAARNTIRSTLCLAVVASILSVLLLAPRTSHWVARVTGIRRPRSALRAAVAFHAIHLSSFWIALIFCSAIPERYDAGGIIWASLLLLALLCDGLGASGWLLTKVGVLRPARPIVVEAVANARGSLLPPGPDVQVFEVELSSANALAYPGAQIVCFTTAAVEGLTPGQLTAIAAHELEHVRESRGTRALRTAWSMAYALPALFIPALPRSPANGLVLGMVLFLLSAFAYRSLSRRLEQRADSAATKNEQDEGQYALALERLYELNLLPAVTRVRQTHPHLYDRLIASGSTPTFPRPRPPSLWPGLLSIVLVVLCSASLGVAQIALTTRVAAGLDLRSEAQLNWAVALEGATADWLTVAGHWLGQGRLHEANLALDVAERHGIRPSQVLRAGLASRSGNCSTAIRLLADAGLTGCSDRHCIKELFKLCNGRRCYAVVSEYSHVLELCPPH
jgi:Zn-dependent protease with chaperone function